MRIAYCVLRIAYCVLRGTLVGAVGGWGCGVWTAADFEDLVHFVDEELEFVVGEVAVHVELFEFSGDGFGAGIAVFADAGGFAAGAREGMDETGESLGIAAKFLVEIGGVRVPEREEEGGDGELEGVFIDFWGMEVVGEIESRFLVGGEFFEPVL